MQVSFTEAYRAVGHAAQSCEIGDACAGDQAGNLFTGKGYAAENCCQLAIDSPPLLLLKDNTTRGECMYIFVYCVFISGII